MLDYTYLFINLKKEGCRGKKGESHVLSCFMKSGGAERLYWREVQMKGGLRRQAGAQLEL